MTKRPLDNPDQNDSIQKDEFASKNHHAEKPTLYDHEGGIIPVVIRHYAPAKHPPVRLPNGNSLRGFQEVDQEWSERSLKNIDPNSIPEITPEIASMGKQLSKFGKVRLILDSRRLIIDSNKKK